MESYIISLVLIILFFRKNSIWRAMGPRSIYRTWNFI